MYKSPELSQMAKVLKSELALKGLLLSHSQSMELTAKMQGSRTLHVEQARPGSLAPEREPKDLTHDEDVLYCGAIQDWARDEGVDNLTALQQRTFKAEVKKSGSQFFVEISLPHERLDEIDGTDQLSLFIEINQGLPCVHISNDLFGDQVLTVFASKDGLYLRPDSLDLSIQTGSPRGEGLQAIERIEQGDNALSRTTWNNAFIETP